MRNVIIFILLCSVIYLFFFYKAPIINKAKEEVTPEMKELADAEVEKVNKLIDQKGFQHAVDEEIENVVRNYTQIVDKAKERLDSVIKLRKIDSLKVIEWRSYAVAFQDSFLAAKQISDSVFKYDGSNLSLEFVNKKDTPYFNYNYNADIDYLRYWDKKSFLSQKKQYMDFWVNDKRATINGVKRIKIEAEPKTVTSIKASSFLNRDYFMIGPEISFEKNRYQINVMPYYDLNSKTWIPSVKGSFSILEF